MKHGLDFDIRTVGAAAAYGFLVFIVLLLGYLFFFSVMATALLCSPSFLLSHLLIFAFLFFPLLQAA